jgi:hypothetical protein
VIPIAVGGAVHSIRGWFNCWNGNLYVPSNVFSLKSTANVHCFRCKVLTFVIAETMDMNEGLVMLME